MQAPRAAARDLARAHWRRVWMDAVAPTLGLRVVLLGFGVLAVVALQPDILAEGPLLGMWNRWDAVHYLGIAADGYGPPADHARMAFFPLYPLLVAIGSVILPNPLLVAMLLSLAFTLAAAAGLYLLARLDLGRGSARAAVVMMSVFPAAFALVAPYSEALFLALVVWSFLCARTDRWPQAGLLALLAGATRLPGAFLLPALLVEYWFRYRRLDRRAAWLLLGAGGPAIYLTVNFAAYGDPLYFMGVQEQVFTNSTVAPWESLRALIAGVTTSAPSATWLTVYLAPLVALLVLGVVTLWAIWGRGGRPSYAVYAAISLLSFASVSWPISLPRFLLGVFPLFLAAGALTTRPWLSTPLFAASTLLLGLFTMLFVMGHWAG